MDKIKKEEKTPLNLFLSKYITDNDNTTEDTDLPKFAGTQT